MLVCDFNPIFSSAIFSNIIAPLLAVRMKEITQVHLLGTLAGMHSRTQRCITNEKSLGPFRPVKPAGLDFKARLGPARGSPGPLLSLFSTE